MDCCDWCTIKVVLELISSYDRALGQQINVGKTELFLAKILIVRSKAKYKTWWGYKLLGNTRST